MRTITFILTFLLFTTLLFGQKEEKIKTIRKTVEKINTDTSYIVKKLDNDYFVNQKNEATDGGQELTGYYKNGQVKKIIYVVGLSYGMTTYEYYYTDNQLLFVFQKQDTYAQVKDSLGQFTGYNYTKLEPAFEGRYYFDKAKLFETKKTGKELFADETDNKENKFIADSKSFLEELKKVKR